MLYHKGWRGVMNASDVILYGLAGIGAAFSGSFAISIVRSTKLLDDDRVAEIGALERQHSASVVEAQALRSQLESPQISPLEKRRRELVAEKFKVTTPEGVYVIDYLLHHGEIAPIDLPSLKFTPSAVQSAIQRGIGSRLLKGHNSKDNAGWPITVDINPELKDAISFHLLENRPVTPPQG